MIIKRIDVDDAPHPASFGQSHRDIDAAPPADDLIGSLKTERVSLKMLQIGGPQCHVCFGIGKSPRIVLTTKRALACTKHLFAWLPVSCQFYTNGTAVTLTLEKHVVGPKVPYQRYRDSCADIGPLSFFELHRSCTKLSVLPVCREVSQRITSTEAYQTPDPVL